MGKLGAIWKPTDVIVLVQMSKEKIIALSLSPTTALIYGVWSTTVTRTCTSSYTPWCGVIRTTPEPIATQANTSSDQPRRAQRVSHPSERFFLGVGFVLLTDSGEPSWYKEAMLTNDKVQWEHVMKREISSIAKNKDVKDLGEANHILAYLRGKKRGMLPIHEHIIGELVQEDGVVVIGAGLGLAKLLASLLRLHSPSEGVVFVLSASEGQRAAIKEVLLEQDSTLQAPIEINNEYTASDRLSFYAQGGVAFITSRILIVDLLNERVPLARVSGLVFLNAHRLSDTSTEAFIARLYRASNRKGFIRAFSDKPQAMISGFSKTERIMRSLFVRRLHLWPRFHMSIASALEENPPQVVDLRVPFTASMHGIHAAILEVMDACLKELKKTNKLDVEDLTIENGLFKSFEEIVRRQLDPIWHTLSRKIKQLVFDLKTLRKLADYLLRYDAITFLKYLDTLRASEDVRSVWIFANPTHKIFELAKRRVFQVVRIDTGDPVVSDRGKKPLQGRSRANSGTDIGAKKRKANDGSGPEVSVSGANESTDQAGGVQDIEVVVMAEEMPKWKVLREVLNEIQEELQLIKPGDLEDDSATVLIACKDERTCLQLQDCVNKGSQKLLGDEWEKYLLGKAELHGMRTRKKRTHVNSKGVGVLNGKLSTRNLSEEDANTARQEEVALLAAAAEVSSREEENRGGKGGRARGRGRGRGRGRTRGAGSGKRSQKEEVNAVKDDTLSVEDPSVSILLNSKQGNLGEQSALPEESLKEVGKLTNIQQEKKPSFLLQFYAIESEQRILDILRPAFVIVYDPDMAFVREMEVYKAERPLQPLKVYFLFYDNSTEAQKFEASIRRENSAFESLIRQKASMMIPVDQHLLDVKKVLLILEDNQFYVNSKKSTFGVQEVSYVGFIISSDGIRLDPEKITAILSWEISHVLTIHFDLDVFFSNVIEEQIRSFVGFCQAYSRHMRNFSTIAAPLTDLLKGCKTKCQRVKVEGKSLEAFYAL
ncbi:hypothetical protein L7F22_012639 [Adiantum nelumboides]|nr:hypothetical protein [Adiantum nelumboides]